MQSVPTNPTRGGGRPLKLTRGRIITGLVTVLLLGGLFLAYDASRHANSTFDVSITRHVQSWDAGVGSFLRVISEITNFWPRVAIWTATFVLLFWRGLRIESFVLLLAVGSFLAAEALGVLVNRPRPSSELVHVSQSLFGNSFPSGVGCQRNWTLLRPRKPRRLGVVEAPSEG